MASMERIGEAARLLKGSRRAILFSGAGISVESGIPPFRGPGGLWSKYDPGFLDIGFFLSNPGDSWRVIKEIFYDNWGEAKPNNAHFAVAELERKGALKAVVTQNIDCLHQRAGSRDVLEFHGSLDRLLCLGCGDFRPSKDIGLYGETPRCPACGGLLKPDIVFFGEPIPENVRQKSFEKAEACDLVIAVGTTGEVMPAGMIPRSARRNGAKVVEINLGRSSLTDSGLSDIFLQGPAGELLPALAEAL